MAERVFMKGCEAIAEAAVRAGCRFFAGYPITPQNEIPEYMARRMPEVGGSFVQGESEVASVNMLYGAVSTGIRAMSSSSSCGISLYSEGISFCASARLPAVYVNVQRGGPGIGAIQPAQQDYLQATKASGNGGFRMIVLAPSTVQECVDMVYKAFDYAESDQNPVLVLTDGVMGTIMEPVVLPPMKSEEEIAEPDVTPKDRMNGPEVGPGSNYLKTAEEQTEDDYNSIDRIVKDPQIAGARKMFPVIQQPGIGGVPTTNNALKFTNCPADPEEPAPTLGQDNNMIFSTYADLSSKEIEELRAKKII